MDRTHSPTSVGEQDFPISLSKTDAHAEILIKHLMLVRQSLLHKILAAAFSMLMCMPSHRGVFWKCFLSLLEGLLAPLEAGTGGRSLQTFPSIFFSA